MASVDRFGFEWATYTDIVTDYETQFKKWIVPLGPADFLEKKVLDAGCGMGRNSYWAARWGADEVVAFDADVRTVHSASETLSGFSNVRVLLKSIYDIEWKDEFDIAFSIGVIHHLADPIHALKNLAISVKPGGVVLIWVYGYEGNEWIVRFVSPIRRVVTSRLPPRLLHFFTYAISVPFYVFLKLAPIRNVYLAQLKHFRFWHVHSIIFDQLLPTIANYYRKDEAIALLSDAGLFDVSARLVNGNSWAVIGVARPRI